MDNAASVRGGGLAGVGAALTLTGCTIEGNAAPAGVGLAVSDGATAIDRTVIAQNQGSSIFCVGGVPQLSCSDLFGNTQGDWIGSFGDQVVLRGNFAADPCFCDDLHLCADSFCAPGQHPWGCDDLVGALGVGCGACGCLGPVATYLVQFAAHAGGGRGDPRLADRARGRGRRVPRAGEPGRRGMGRADRVGGRRAFTACDESVHLQAGGQVTYSLDLRTGPDAWPMLHGESVRVPATAATTRLTSAYPNPFNPSVTVAFTVTRPQHVRIAIHDATGRLVAVVTDQTYGAGLHSAIWDGRSRAGGGAVGNVPGAIGDRRRRRGEEAGAGEVRVRAPAHRRNCPALVPAQVLPIQKDGRLLVQLCAWPDRNDRRHRQRRDDQARRRQSHERHQHQRRQHSADPAPENVGGVDRAGVVADVRPPPRRSSAPPARRSPATPRR